MIPSRGQTPKSTRRKDDAGDKHNTKRLSYQGNPILNSSASGAGVDQVESTSTSRHLSITVNQDQPPPASDYFDSTHGGAQLQQQEIDDSAISGTKSHLASLLKDENDNLGSEEGRRRRPWWRRRRHSSQTEFWVFGRLILGCLASAIVMTFVVLMTKRHRHHHNPKHNVPFVHVPTPFTPKIDGTTENGDSTNSCNASFMLNSIGWTIDQYGMAETKYESSITVPAAAVASDHPICSQVGSNILQNLNGNAVDAAVAVALCLGVVNPSSSGLGGGHFMLIHMVNNNTVKNNTTPITELIDAREMAPGAATYDMYDRPDIADDASTVGGLAVGVWGELKGLELAHQRHGRLEWNQVVEPAIQLASDGFPITFSLARAISFSLPKLEKFPALYQLFTKPLNNDTSNNKRFSNDSFFQEQRIPLEEGDVLIQPKLAETLQDIAREGAKVLYEGPRAQAMIDELRDKHNGIITMNDFSRYEAKIRQPLKTFLPQWGMTVVGAPPPSSGGGTVLGVLRFLSGYLQPQLVFQKQTLTQHLLVEAFKHAFALRMSLSDPDFSIVDYSNGTAIELPNPSSDVIQDLIEGTYMETLRVNYTRLDTVMPITFYGGPKWNLLQQHTNDDNNENNNDDDDNQQQHETSETTSTANLPPPAVQAKGGGHDNPDRRRHRHRQRNLKGFQYLNDHGTSSFSIVDTNGNAVACSSTINTEFGSGIYLESAGILLNNEMDDFSSPLNKPNTFGLMPSKANYIAPFKRPLSSMAPTMIFQTSDNDSTPMMVLGASGGPKIITAVVQVILNYLILGMSLVDSVLQPRLHDQLIYHGQPQTTLYDNIRLSPRYHFETSNVTLEALRQRHHNLLPSMYQGTCQAIVVETETNILTAVSDPRKGGQPAGY